MKVLIAPTEDFIKRTRSKLAADVIPASSVVITLANTTGFAINQYVVVGYEGSQQAEIAKITAVTGETLTLDVLHLTHDADEPVVTYRYNKRKFYGSLTQGGAYTELTASGSPVGIGINNPQGTVLEYSTSEGYTYFKATYFNSQTSEESNIADADPVLGDESVRYCSIYAIRKQAGLTNNPFITDGIIETYRKRAENEVNSYLNARYILPLANSSGTQEIPFLVENCTVLLAAGYMDYQEFGGDGEGVKWLGESRSILKKLQSPGGQQLLGTDLVEMQTKLLSNSVQSYPDQVDNDNGPTQHFTMDQRF